MHQLGGITDRIGRNRIHSQFIELAGRAAGQDHPVVQAGKQREPERIILIHIQNARQADLAADGPVGRQRFVAEQALVFVGVEIGAVAAGGGFADAPLAAVAGVMLLAVGKTLGGDQTLVAAALAAMARIADGEGVQLRRRQQSAWLARNMALAGNERRAEGPHETGDVRSDHFPAQ